LHFPLIAEPLIESFTHLVVLVRLERRDKLAYSLYAALLSLPAMLAYARAGGTDEFVRGSLRSSTAVSKTVVCWTLEKY
jgi:hypothetical protein